MNPAATCTHLMPSGHACQSPAVKGTALCFHHSALKTATDHTADLKHSPYGGWQPLPFVFPEDRAALQINYFILLQAFNAHAIDMRTFNALHRLLRSTATNLGKTPLTAKPAETNPANADGGPCKQSLRGEQGTPAEDSPNNSTNEADYRAHPFQNLIPEVVPTGPGDLKDLAFLLDQSRRNSERRHDETTPR